MDSGAWHGFTTLRSTYNRSERNALYSELMFAEDLVEYCVCASDPFPFKPLVKILPQTNVCIFVRTIGEAWSPFQSHTNNPKTKRFTSSIVYLHSDPINQTLGSQMVWGTQARPSVARDNNTERGNGEISSQKNSPREQRHDLSFTGCRNQRAY